MRNIFFNKKFSGITETNPGFFDGWGLGEGLNVKVDKQEIVYPTLHEKIKTKQTQSHGLKINYIE